MDFYLGKSIKFVLELRWWQWLLIGYILILPLALRTISLALQSNQTPPVTIQKPSLPSLFTFMYKNPTPTSSPTPTSAVLNATTKSQSPTSSHNSSAPTATPTPKPQPTNTPLPSSDTTAPVFAQITGPDNGSTTSDTNVCFPMHITDNVTAYPQVRVMFDSNTWGNWSTNYSPCYSNLSNTSHTFSAQAKDDAGNLSAVVTRTFTVIATTHMDVSIIGHVFSDTNCNDVQDTGENTITGIVMAIQSSISGQGVWLSTQTDTNGNYHLTGTLGDNLDKDMYVAVIPPSGYKIHKTPQLHLTATNSSATLDLPLVPNEDTSFCAIPSPTNTP